MTTTPSMAGRPAPPASDPRGYVLERRQWVPRGLPETFAFFERPENLSLLTPPWLAFRIATPGPLRMREGLVLDYRLRLFGLPARWRSRIVDYDPPRGFRDVQVRGPYRAWDHAHRFRPEAGGTVVHDLVRYALPLGPLGRLAHAAAVARRLRAIFDYRSARIESLLAGPPAGGPPRAGAPGAGATPAGDAAARRS